MLCASSRHAARLAHGSRPAGHKELKQQLCVCASPLQVDTDEESGLASELQIQGLPTLIFVPVAKDKPALVRCVEARGEVITARNGWSATRAMHRLVAGALSRRRRRV